MVTYVSITDALYTLYKIDTIKNGDDAYEWGNLEVHLRTLGWRVNQYVPRRE